MGGAKSTMDIRSQGIKLGSGEDWFEPVLNIHTPPLPHTHLKFFYPPLFNSADPKKFLSGKNIEGGIPALAPSPSSAYA
jgi:hypothetical protein